MMPGRREGHFFFLRFIIVSLCGLGLLGGTLFVLTQMQAPCLAYVLLLPIALVLSAAISRKLLVKYRTRCPVCGLRDARIDTIESKLWLSCPDCGHKEETGYDWSDAGG
jgi:hypothetical protein